MVGYAGKYPDNEGGERQYVGDVYVNFAKAEEHPTLLEDFACKLLDKMDISDVPMSKIDVLCGAPMGGLAFNTILGLIAKKRTVYPEKKITALKTENSREQSVLAFDRHEVYAGEQVAIVEDVSNNFSTTNEMVSLIEKSGATVAAILSFLNRSTIKDRIREAGEKYEYILEDGRALPVISLVRQAFGQFRQDENEEIADMIASGRVVWKPKHEWHRLTEKAAAV